jgi:hypothetical protein
VVGVEVARVVYAAEDTRFTDPVAANENKSKFIMIVAFVGHDLVCNKRGASLFGINGIVE